MALKLWGSPTSGCAHRVMITLNELRIEYDLSQITLQKGEQKDPDYIKTYHSFGRIPVIQDGDLQLFESRAISRYIVANEKLWKNPAEAANPLEVEKATAMFKTALDYYEELLGSNAYLVGDVFTWMPYIKFLGLYDEAAARPEFEGLWKRVSTRPSWQKVLKDMPQ
ncbi:Glutathione S-transferase F12 [Colletotrichum viniferum]|nr:Glutathione S-transferase F12 [Colletotrichum viniferum]